MSKDCKARAARRRKDEAFKREAMCLWKSSGRAAETTAGELALRVIQQYEWRKEFPDTPRPWAGAPPKTMARLQAANDRLRQEVTCPTDQREILKNHGHIPAYRPLSRPWSPRVDWTGCRITAWLGFKQNP